jgi:hypothetical protein
MAAVIPATPPLVLLAIAMMLASCRKPAGQQTDTTPPPPAAKAEETGALAKVGSVTIYQSDLDHHLKERFGGRHDEATRQKALDDLSRRARLVQAALDADLARDPVVRADTSRLLAGRYKEQALAGPLAAITAPIPEARLRELYDADAAHFRRNERRRVAVLWLNPGGNPERETSYRARLAEAREWFFKNGDLKDHPEQGFSVLGVDYSEHHASRFKGGIIEWLEREGGMDAWTKAVAEIAFSLPEKGQVSEVISRAEGVFLVRHVDSQAAVQRPFEAARGEIERTERQRLRQQAEAAFEKSIDERYPVQWIIPSP